MLTSRGLKPQLHWLDNEASTASKNFITKQQTQYQLTPPHIHQRNAAKRAIRTFQNHFISVYALSIAIFLYTYGVAYWIKLSSL